MRSFMAAGWFYSSTQISNYFRTRLSSLKPPENARSKNPITVLRQLNRHQMSMFLVGFLGWMWDTFDFMAVSLSLTDIARDFDVAYSDVAWGLTISLMFRSVGALSFGLLADRYGRKLPFIGSLCAMVLIEIGIGFASSLSHFIGLRALYGITMGGLFGPAASTALEDLPYEARGILSGLFEQGYSVGFLLAAVFYRVLVPTTVHGWRSLFWFSAVPPVMIIAFRLCLPETNHFLVQKAERETKHAIRHSDHNIATNKHGLRAFAYEAENAVKRNWVMLLYMIALMTGLNACSHGGQDLYPTFLKDQLGESASDTTLIIAVGEIGELIGGTLAGYLSSIFGRRLTMICTCIVGGALVPAYVGTKDLTVMAPVFFESFFLGGVWGPVPIHLMELAPPAFRSLAVGLSHQLGNLIASSAAVIESKLGESHPLPPAADGTLRFDYGKIIGIFTGASWAYVLVCLLLGPEMGQEEREELRLEAEVLEAERRNGGDLGKLGMKRAEEEKEKEAELEVKQVEDKSSENDVAIV